MIFYEDCRQLTDPLPSDIKLTFEFSKAPDNVLLHHVPAEGDNEVNPKFRILLRYFELYVPRLIGK